MLYRILTEQKNLPNVIKIVSEHFDGFTLIKGKGYWQRVAENSLIIEIDACNKLIDVIRQTAEEIRDYNKQQCVMVQCIESKVLFV